MCSGRTQCPDSRPLVSDCFSCSLSSSSPPKTHGLPGVLGIQQSDHMSPRLQYITQSEMVPDKGKQADSKRGGGGGGGGRVGVGVGAGWHGARV